MIKLINTLKNKRGEGYVDVVVTVLIFMMLLVLALNMFSFLTVKQDMDYYAKEMIYCASANGRTAYKVDARKAELTSETGLNPTVTWQATYFNTSDQTVQYGDTITVTLTYNTYFKGFGVFRIPITLTAKYSGLSMKYFK
ncbi:MAG: hypothetical protein A2Y17_13270 [Clostridiales bacterium GWF2_38_85]|nr:MAG: hypothetical protein A2Y17_13270 [Clostridiales bacterium GWF2_38_85]